MRTVVLLSALLALAGCARTATWAVNLGVDDDRIESVVYDRATGLVVDIHRPTGDRPAPVIVYLHGGGWKNGDRGTYRFVGERLASHGALVLVPDYRKAPAHPFPAFVEDAARAVAWAKANAARLGGDPDRIHLMGHSAGAHIAALLATDARWLGAVDSAPRELAGVIGWAGPYDFLPITDIGLIDVFGTGKHWPATQPGAFVDGDEPPFLLVHGDDDDTVDVGDSRALHAKLAAAGVRSRLAVIRGAGHAGLLVDLKRPGTGEALGETLAFVGLR